MIDLYACGSPNVLKVLFMLSEAELAYTLREVNVAAGEQFSAEIVGLNPNSKLPVIVDHDGPHGRAHTVFESGAILLYLAEKSQRLLPTDPAARSCAVQWLMWQMASVGPMFGQALHFRYIAPQDIPYARGRYLREVNRLYDVLETRLGSATWLAGDEFSVADVAVFPWVGKYVKTLEIDIDTRPAVARWIDAVESRHGYRRIEELGKQLFKQTLASINQAAPEQRARFFGFEEAPSD